MMEQWKDGIPYLIDSVFQHSNIPVFQYSNIPLFQYSRKLSSLKNSIISIQRQKVMKITHIEHIGIAVSDLQKAIRYYEEVLGIDCYGIEEVEDQKVRTAFFRIGETKIELLQSTDPEGPVGKFIRNRGEGIHHIAFATNDVENALKEAEKKGVQLIDKHPRKGAEGFMIGFIHPKSTFGVLTEFCGEK